MSFFFCTGYPRSRSAWLANLFTWGKSICLHDELAEHESIESFANRLRELHEMHHSVGVSDSALLLFYAPIMEQFPDSQWLIVERPYNTALASFVDSGYATLSGAKGYFDMVKNSIAKIPKDGDLMFVPYLDLDDLDVLASMWDFVLPYEMFPRNRAEALNAMRITQIKSKRNIDVDRVMKLVATLEEGVLA